MRIVTVAGISGLGFAAIGAGMQVIPLHVPPSVGYGLIILGTALLLGAFLKHLRNLKLKISGRDWASLAYALDYLATQTTQGRRLGQTDFSPWSYDFARMEILGRLQKEGLATGKVPAIARTPRGHAEIGVAEWKRLEIEPISYPVVHPSKTTSGEFRNIEVDMNAVREMWPRAPILRRLWWYYSNRSVRN